MDGVDGFIQAKHYSPANQRPTLWVIHDEEYPERVDAAWDVARFFAGANAPQASAHVCVDNVNAVGCVDWRHNAWHSGHGPTNARSVGVEHSGYASQTTEEWLDEYGRSMLDRSARLFAEIGHGQFGIPARWLSPAEVAAGQSGICGHGDVTTAFGIYGGHTDPGVNFPRDYFVDLCRKHIGGTADQEDDMKSLMVLDPDSKTGEVWECWGLWRKHIASVQDRDMKKFFGVQYFGEDSPAEFRRFCIRTTQGVVPR
jgi:hypothetical protein